MSRPGLGSRLSSNVPSVFSLRFDEDEANTQASSITPPTPASAREPESSDIAVIGYSCRAPGGNNSPSQLWDFLLKKGDASGEMPEMRWKPYMTRQPGNDKILSKTTSKGYFLDNLENFDAPFFGISPREAEQIDPQQRLAVECAWEALEDAGIAPQSLAGSDTAVFMGVNSDDYARLLLEDLPQVQAWMGVGTAFCGIPNRISYLLDLMGPSSAVDAACASSLVAIHHGKQALLQKETSLVIAGGVNALIGPGLTRVLDEAGAIASDGRCRSFDESAAGYGRGEGAGVVILKRLTDALQDDDNILAVLKGSAVGADGKTNGIMAPCQAAQEQVARKALKEARFSAESISYIEAHATSTPLGDPTECAAMANVYGKGARNQDAEPVIIGSIKPNIGHLEAGAGVLGFIKAVMVLQNEAVPPQANLENLSSKIDFDGFKLRPVTEKTPLSKNEGPLRAAIASYGYGGTVSHAVIEAAPAKRPSLRRLLARTADRKEPSVLLLSGVNDSRLKSSAASLAEWMKDSTIHRLEDVDLQSLSYTLAVKRGHHKNRAAVVAHSPQDALEQLELLSQGKQSPQIAKGRILPEDQSQGAVWVFSGHGAQWDGMGKQLMDTEPSFMETINELEPIVRKYMDFSITAALQDGGYDSTDKVQIMTYAMQVGLISVLKARGMKPKACVGHSLGELAAAVAAGALSMVEAAVVCCVRAKLYQRVAGDGAMVLINIPFHDAAQDIEGRKDVTVAIDSSPSSCVISGTTSAIEECTAMWTAKGVSVKRVKTDVAFHSEVLSPLANPLREGVGKRIDPRKPQVTLYSTSMADPRSDAPRDIEYWVNNMIKPVLLSSAVSAAAEDGNKVFLEISSHPIVTHSINETLMDQGVSDTLVIPTILRKKNSRQNILMALGKLHCAGLSVDFESVLPGTWLQDAPRTSWEHQPYWKEVTVPEPVKNVTHDPTAHTILGSRTQVVGTDVTLWQTHLNPKVKPFPGNHPLHGSEIIPAAVLLNTFLSAHPGNALANVSLRVPVVVDPPKDLQLIGQNNNLKICSKLTSATSTTDSDESSWLVNTTTQTVVVDESAVVPSVNISELKARLPNRLSNSFSIDYLDKVGVSEMGFPWAVTEHLESDEEMLACVDADPTQSEQSPHFNGKSWASVLDAATSVSSTVFYKDPLLRMPTAIERVQVLPGAVAPKISYIHVKKVPNTYAADIRIYNEDGKPLVDIQALAFAGIDGSLSSKQTDANLVHKICWPPALLSENPLQFTKVTFVANNSPLLDLYESELASRGIETETVSKPADLAVQDDSIVLMLADGTTEAGDVYQTSATNCENLLDITKKLIAEGSKSRVFAITQGVFKGDTHSALAQSPLVGLSRIVQSEEPEVFGGMIDVEDNRFPFQAIKYVQNVDVIRIEDSVARNARLRPFSQDNTKSKGRSFKVRPQGTYVITGGLGALGLEVANFLAEQGARRIVLVSRREMPLRHTWESLTDNTEIQQMLQMEALGVSVYPVAVDMTAVDSASQLESALMALRLPPVLGVIHAAGTLANEMVTETTTKAFNSVIKPKIQGAMALDKLFPAGTLDWMVLFSSCGQLLGFPGQAAYGSGNAFLDSMAARRRALGENAISMMWTSWRGLGMAASTKYIDAELAAKGVTDVTKGEAFRAWQQIFTHDTDHAVVLRTMTIEADDAVPHPILNDCIVRNAPAAGTAASTASKSQTEAAPTSGPELEVFLNGQVTKSVADTLGLAPETVDPNVALTELGVDSVMTVELRGRLQKAVGVKVGPTLIWNCPTVALLVKHFVEAKSK